MYRVTYKKEGEEPITPIRKYQIEHCLGCELPAHEKGKTCDYDGMLLCVSIRLLGLKEDQMRGFKGHGGHETKLTDYGY